MTWSGSPTGYRWAKRRSGVPEKSLSVTDAAPVPTAFTVLSDAWEALFRANEAFAAVDATGSKEYARIGMQVLRNRALGLVAALDDLIEETSR